MNWVVQRFIVLMVLNMLAGCGEDHGKDSLQALQRSVRDVILFRIEQRVQPVIYAVPGSVVPAQRLKITSRISGFIEQIHVDEGNRVELGTALVDIDDTQLEANIRVAQASLASAKADLADARADVERYQSLATKQVLAEDQLRDARVRSALAKAQVEKMQAELDARREERRYVRLTTPVRALVRERLRDPGDMIIAGEPVLHLDALGQMEFEVFVPSTQIDSVSAGEVVEVALDHASTHLFGKVVGVVHSADTTTRRYKVRIELPDNPHLAPGQYGIARLRIGEESVTILPDAAVVEHAGIEGVFVVDAEQKVRFRSVRLGRRWGTDREVLAGVESGSTVAMKPPSDLRDGDRVRKTKGDAN
ncbi:MAG: efflux RND transporter periplasmic adaptor subunit [Anaerolineae bacterium]|nr:efflux RND transporter periplasmic adaptor subunit [Anaerolineae bacterium]